MRYLTSKKVRGGLSVHSLSENWLYGGRLLVGRFTGILLIFYMNLMYTQRHLVKIYDKHLTQI